MTGWTEAEIADAEQKVKEAKKVAHKIGHVVKKAKPPQQKLPDVQTMTVDELEEEALRQDKLIKKYEKAIKKRRQRRYDILAVLHRGGLPWADLQPLAYPHRGARVQIHEVETMIKKNAIGYVYVPLADRDDC